MLIDRLALFILSGGRKMNRIKNHLESRGVYYQIEKKITGSNETIVILLETGCFWVNAYNEKIYYNRVLRITQNTYKKYILYEVTGYNMGKEQVKSGRQSDIILFLDKRL